MAPLRRFSVAPLRSLFILAAVSCNVASGLPRKAADGNGDFASVALEPGPHAAAGASVTVGTDGSLLVRMIGTNGLMDGHAVDDITRADSAETSEFIRITGGALVDDGTVGVSKDFEFGTRSRSSSKQESLLIGIVILLIVAFGECLCLIRMGRKPPAGKPLLAPAKAEEPAVRPSQQRQSMAEADDPKNADAAASDEQAAASEQPKGKAKGKGDSKASADEDDSKAGPGPSSKGKGKAPDGTPSTNEITGKGGASEGGDVGKAGEPSPPVPAPQPEESGAGADFARVATGAGPVACDDYRVDIHGANFGQCKCGAAKADHKNPRSSLA